MTKLSIAATTFALLLAACSSNGNGGATPQDDGGSHADGGGTDGSSHGNDAGTTPAGAGLVGTWDLFASNGGGAPSAGLLELSPTKLVVSIGGYVLAYETDGASSMKLTWTTPREAHALTTTRSPAALDLGIVPLALGGDWSFSEPGYRNTCTGRAHDGAIDTECLGLFYNFPIPTIAGKMTAARASTLPSKFGALGGVWNITTSSGAQCQARFDGATFTNTCSGSEIDGSVTLSFSDGLASGTTNTGIELSARRR